jgi:histone chaperone ASF1
LKFNTNALQIWLTVSILVASSYFRPGLLLILTHMYPMFQIRADLEWKLTYVGSAESEKYDQTLDAVFVGPVACGQYRFVFQADPPDFSKIPSDDVVGVTIILLTCSYRNQEFLRVGYYVNNEYAEEELRDNPPTEPKIDL